MLHYALRSGGFLMLGRVGVTWAPPPISLTFSISATRSSRETRSPPDLPVEFGRPLPRRGQAASEPSGAGGAGHVYPDPHVAAGGTVDLPSYTPASGAHRRRLEIVQFFGQTEPYLQHAGRACHPSICWRMAREGLAALCVSHRVLARSEGAPRRRDAWPARATAANCATVDRRGRPAGGPPEELTSCSSSCEGKRLGQRGSARPVRPADAERRGGCAARELDSSRHTCSRCSARKTRVTRSCAPPTRRSSRATRSCSPSTRSSRRPRRSCSRPTKSCAPSTRSSRAAICSSSRRTTTSRAC